MSLVVSLAPFLPLELISRARAHRHAPLVSSGRRRRHPPLFCVQSPHRMRDTARLKHRRGNLARLFSLLPLYILSPLFSTQNGMRPRQQKGPESRRTPTTARPPESAATPHDPRSGPPFCLSPPPCCPPVHTVLPPPPVESPFPAPLPVLPRWQPLFIFFLPPATSPPNAGNGEHSIQRRSQPAPVNKPESRASLGMAVAAGREGSITMLLLY